VVFSAVPAGCSDRDAENESVSPVTSQQASETIGPAHTGSGDHDAQDSDDGQMDHGGPVHEHETGGHGDTTAHEEQEGMAHEYAEHAGSHWNAPVEAATLTNPVAADAASVQRGRDLFVINCVSCHGNSGRGDGPVAVALTPKPVDLVVMAPMHPAGDFFWKIENGRGPMPAWKKTLSGNQIWDLVNYIKSLGEAEPSAADTDDNNGHNHSHP
jgi:mono/diheme cytochrome c family protein